MKCYVLEEVSESRVSARESRLAHIQHVFTLAGFEVVGLGEEICSGTNVSALETQQGAVEALRVAYADAIFNGFERKQYAPGLIVATESWHETCFRGMLKLGNGKFVDNPVVEAWVDYPTSFSRFRIFPTQFNMGFAAAQDRRVTPTTDWVKIPYPMPPVSRVVKFVKEEIDEKNPFSVRSLSFMAVGQPIVAPDFGSWSELVSHGVSGALYRSVEGRKKAIEVAQTLNPETISAYVKEKFSIEKAVGSLEGFLRRVKNA